MTYEKYISLGMLAQETGLPVALLKRYALEEKIPALKTPRRLMFRLSAVQQALDNLENSAYERSSGEISNVQRTV